MLGVIRELVRRGHDVQVLNGAEDGAADRADRRPAGGLSAYPQGRRFRHDAQDTSNLVAFMDMMLKATPPLADFTPAHLPRRTGPMSSSTTPSPSGA